MEQRQIHLDSIERHPILLYKQKLTIQDSVHEFNVEGKPIHPTQKPFEIFEYLIRSYTNKNEVVLDNCSGSGTTAIASIKSKRKYILIEKEEEYYEKSKKRIQEFIENSLNS